MHQHEYELKIGQWAKQTTSKQTFLFTFINGPKCVTICLFKFKLMTGNHMSYLIKVTYFLILVNGRRLKICFTKVKKVNCPRLPSDQAITTTILYLTFRWKPGWMFKLYAEHLFLRIFIFYEDIKLFNHLNWLSLLFWI